MVSRTPNFASAACIALFFSTANAQFGWHGDGSDGNGGNGDHRPWYDDGGEGSDANANFFGQSGGFFNSNSPGYRALVAHAVIASTVWVVLIPLGGILLRLNVKSPWILRAHAVLQIVSFLLYIVAVGLGIYLIQNMSFGGFGSSMWNDPHPPLGLAILALAFIQPFLGGIHHRMFKKRVTDTKAGRGGPAPGRTVPGYMHLWLGRILIVLGIINGGLGIRLASRLPFQGDTRSRTAAIVYGVVAGVMFLLYLLFVLNFERKKANTERGMQQTRGAQNPMEEVPPTYVESQESLQKDHSGATRYS